MHYARARAVYLAIVVPLLVSLALLALRCDAPSLRLAGTAGTIPQFVDSSRIGDSLLSQVGAYLRGPQMSLNGNVPTGAGDLEATTINGVAVASGPSTVAVTHASGVGAVNLTTEGTLDWFRVNNASWPPCVDVAISAKATGGRYLECDAITLAQSGCSATSGTDGAMTYALTAGDSTDSAPTTGNARYQALLSGPTTSPWGFRVIVKTPLATPLVVRAYWAQDPGMTSTCTATLSDGTTASDAGITGLTYIKSEVAFQSAVAGSTLISCVVTSRGVVVTPFVWIAFVTVGSV